MFLSVSNGRWARACLRGKRHVNPGVSRRRLPPVELLEDRTLLTTPTVGLISENYSGTDSAAVGALFPSVSADGRYVAFESGSFQGYTLPAPSDLVNGLTVQNDAPNVYLRDLQTNTTICLSLDYQTGTTGNDDSRYPVISGDGSTVVFLSNATDLTANDNAGNNPNDDQNVFAWTRATGKVTLVTVNYQGTGPANDPDPQQFGTAENVGVSANGRYVIYDSEATNLVPNENDINFTSNVYVRDLQTSTTILVSRNAAGTQIGNGPSNNPVISSDGSTVAYDSLANNLDPNFTGLPPFENYQVYVSTINGTNDTVTATHLASVDPTGTKVGNETSIFPSLSDNGQMLAFQSASTNLVNIPNGGSYNDVYVRNLATSTTQLVSVNDTNTATGDSSSFQPQMSGDGKHVLFYSLADNLTTNDSAGTSFSDEDVFERNLTTNTTQLVSLNTQGTTSGDDTSHLANETIVNAFQQETGQISDNGQYVIFVSIATDLVPNFVQLSGGDPFGYDVYLRDTVGEKTTLLSHAVGLADTGGTGESGTAAMTPDGLNVVFQSAFPGNPDNLVTNDTYGQTQLFYTHLGAVAPQATTQVATSVTTSAAKLNGSVNPEGSTTTVTFVYGTDPTLTSGTTTTGQSIGSGTSAVAVNAALTGLTAGTKYYFEVEASSTGGTTTGSILNFTTTAAGTAPQATTQAATTVTTSGAKLNGSVNPEGSATTVTFVYGTDPTLTSGTTTTTGQSIGSGTSAVAVNAALTGLTAGTKYYFEVKANNSNGTTTGSILNFTTMTATGTAPLATTQAATSVTVAGATLHASVNPEGSATTVTFVYGTDPTLTSGTTTTGQSIGSGTSAVAVNAALTGLTAGTKYYFEVEASSTGGTTTGSILNFTTTAAGTAPQATTQAATTVTTSGAKLNGSVNPEGSATTVTFVYGTDPTLTSGTTTTTGQSIGSGTSAVAVNAALTGLTAGTKYYFEVEASSTGGTTTGSILSFVTAANPPSVLQFSSGVFVASITDGFAQVVLTRSGNLSSTVTVVLSSLGGSDVAPFQRQITFAPSVSTTTASIPLANDGKPGEADASIAPARSSPGAGAKLGSAAATLIVHDSNPYPAPVRVISVSTPKVAIKVGTGKRAKTKNVTVLRIQFSGNVASGALNAGAYHVKSGKTKKSVTIFNKKRGAVVVQLRSRYIHPDHHPCQFVEFDVARAASNHVGVPHRRLWSSP